MTCTNPINAHKITVTGGPNPGLITLPNSAIASITFAGSNNVADVGIYNIAVQISTDGGITWSAAVTGTFTYVHPCSVTVVNGPALIYDFIEFAGYNKTSNISYTFNDTVSQSLTLATDASDYCGDKEFSFRINSV